MAYRVTTVAAAWPVPGPDARAGLARIVSALPDGEIALIDGLIASPAAAQLLPHAGRIRMTVLLHMPLATARQLAGKLPCRFEQVHLPPLPEGRFEVVFLLETMLAFPDKEALVGEVARVLEPGGRFAFTVEEGRPLTQQERARMPAADTVWPIELEELTGVLRNAGLAVTWRQEYSSAHHAIATALHRCYRADASQIAAQIGTQATAELITAHQLWSDWLSSGRVRKFALVAEKQ